MNPKNQAVVNMKGFKTKYVSMSVACGVGELNSVTRWPELTVRENDGKKKPIHLLLTSIAHVLKYR